MCLRSNVALTSARLRKTDSVYCSGWDRLDHPLESKGVGNRGFYISSYRFRHCPDCRADLFTGLHIPKNSGTPCDNFEPRRMKQIYRGQPGEPSEMGSVQQAAVLIDKMTAVDFCLNSPVLRI